jgi:DNA polymerase III subunit epsilon
MKDRPLIVFDLETTGTDPAKDKVVSFAAVWRDEDGDEISVHYLINPGRPIPKGASDVHGITDEMVADRPTFDHFAKDIAEIFDGADVGGYNSNRFDVPMLAEELARCGIDFHDPERRFYDAFVVFRKKHPRDLAAAHMTYCGTQLEGAHDALCDAEATLHIIEAQRLMHDEVHDIEDAHEFCEFGERLDFAGNLVMKDGKPCFGFGKHKDRPILLDHETRGYADWMLRSDFSEVTKNALRRVLGYPVPGKQKDDDELGF